MCFYYDEECDFWRTDVRRARKQHDCGDCVDKIQPGDVYAYAVSLSELPRW